MVRNAFNVFILALLIVLVALAFGLHIGNKAEPEIMTPDVNFNYISETAILDVMTAQVNILEDVTIGNAESPDYKRVYSQKGTVVYSIDLSEVTPYRASNGSETVIFVPLPELDAALYIDETTTKNIAEYQKNRFAGSAKDGFSTYLNTAMASHAEMERAIKDYDGLYTMAKSIALDKVRMLISETLVEEDVSLEVYFSERRDGNV